MYAAHGDPEAVYANSERCKELLGRADVTLTDVDDVEHITSLVLSIPRVAQWFATLPALTRTGNPIADVSVCPTARVRRGPGPATADARTGPARPAAASTRTRPVAPVGPINPRAPSRLVRRGRTALVRTSMAGRRPGTGPGRGSR
jgi:hypothetical protein